MSSWGRRDGVGGGVENDSLGEKRMVELVKKNLDWPRFLWVRGNWVEEKDYEKFCGNYNLDSLVYQETQGAQENPF